jgi:hypothetical protein
VRYLKGYGFEFHTSKKNEIASGLYVYNMKGYSINTFRPELLVLLVLIVTFKFMLNYVKRLG